MRFDKLTIRAQEAFQEAQGLTQNFQHSTIEVEHLLLALLIKEGVTRPLLEKLGVR